MSIYGTLSNNIEESANGLIAVDEARDPERVSLVVKINGSINKSLTKLGIKASVKEHKFTHGVSKFTNNKKESFKVDIILEAITQSALKNIISALPIPLPIKVIICSIIDGFTQNETLNAVNIITAAEDDIAKNLKKDIPDTKLKIQSIQKDGRYTNAVLMTIAVE